MVLFGTIINGLTIITGTVIGKFLSKIPERIKSTVMHGIGLAVTVLGIQMALKTEQFLFVILSLVLGAVLGEWVDLDDKLNKCGQWLEKKIGRIGNGQISQGFVTATLIFVIGAMAVLGALDSGINNNHDILITKAIIDGFTALILTTTLGIGVLFSFIPVVLYQGTIALLAAQIVALVPDSLLEQMILELTATGGVMIMAIGLNLTGITKIRVANLLPGILIVVLLVALVFNVQIFIS
ncbi:hypothetical protein SAMN05877753_10120 [Bacillus oleivorans]|uniref:Membrane protein YdfK n=1 Tax=Bacillus oleivorans TaxID=1448271 RepID=A0A285CGR6_9BACI|nr:DUF554 domain-containing protein [Bacillus oleivorans]SNX66709.1 hypothetical protein SAMN05877753_10120 [Bacillus oleivorans]